MAEGGYTLLHSETGVPIVFGGASVVWGIGRPAAMPSLAAYPASDYALALADLLPMGGAWPRDAGSPLMLLLAGLAEEFGRIDARAVALLDEIVPSRTTELLSDWERCVGLPDPCVTQAQTVAERRLALEGRLTSVGGQSKAFFLQLAARLGYSITIDEFSSALEATAAGISFTGDGWAHIWRVNVPTTVGVTPFRVGSGSVGEPLRAWSNEVLECQINRFKPAHTLVLFAYAA